MIPASWTKFYYERCHIECVEHLKHVARLQLVLIHLCLRIAMYEHSQSVLADVTAFLQVVANVDAADW